jgi:hypothetical protein
MGSMGMTGATGAQGNAGPTGPQGPAGTGGFVHHIGEQFGGGVIFHLWKDNAGFEHGLVVAITDQGTSIPWSNLTGTMIGSSAQSTWDGLTNSNAIVSQVGHTTSAAKLCLDLLSGGQSDWYLPSIDELSLLWHNRFNVNKTLSSMGGAQVFPQVASYWSSTEGLNSLGVAWYFDFIGHANTSGNYYTKDVRAIRAF